MASLNVDKTKTLRNISKAFPRLRKPDNIAKVIYAGLALNAVSKKDARNRGAFETEGAPSYGVTVSYKLKLLDAKKAPRIQILIHKRPGYPRPKILSERATLLKKERAGLYNHLLNDNEALKSVVEFLELPKGSSVVAVRNRMETGDTDEDITRYDGVVKQALEDKGLYKKDFDYYWMGFRHLSYKYWLTQVALKLVVYDEK